MTMTLQQIRLNQSQVLTNILLGFGQGAFVAERLFPRLPQALSSVVLGRLGNEALQQYNLARAPASATKRVEINYQGETYTVRQHAVEVPVPREHIREAEAAKRLGIAANLDISTAAVYTASQILALDYEIEAAGLATNTASYPTANSVTLSGSTQWTSDTSDPVDDVLDGAETIRTSTGKRPNTLVLGAAAFAALIKHPKVRGYLPNTQLGPATVDQLKTIFNVESVETGDAIWIDGQGVAHDVWGGDAILAYTPKFVGAQVNLAEPAFGFTNVLEGHPFVETPYYEDNRKSWIYGVTYERAVNLSTPAAGFLFKSAV